MTLFHLVLVALVQGVTEFLPISSTAHLILAPMVTGEADQGPLIDVAVHVGTLGAVLLAFRAEVAEAVIGFFRLLRGDTKSWPARLALYLILATIPVVLAGLVIHETIGMEALRSIELIAWTTIIFGILLWLADRFGPQHRAMDDLRLRDIAFLGVAQAIALAPGTSRSGVTMTAGRFLGLERTDAARFSMLMAIPTILAAGALGGLDIVKSGDARLGMDAIIAAGLSFIAALIAIKLFMRYIAAATMTPFVIYRLALGAVLLLIAYA